MGKIFYGFMGVLLSLSLLGCQVSPTNETETDIEVETETESETESVAGANGIRLVYDDVVYNEEIKNVDTDEVLGTKKDVILAAYRDQINLQTAEWSSLEYLFNFYDVGVLQKEPYKGWTLLVLDLGCDGMCFNDSIYKYAWNRESNKMILLANISNVEFVSDYVKTIQDGEDTTATLSGQPPEKIEIPDTDYELVVSVKNSAYTMATKNLPAHELGELAFKVSDLGEVYFLPSDSQWGCVELKIADGTISTYAYDTGFFGDKAIFIDWKDGSARTNLNDKYTYSSGGCGIMFGCYMLEEANIDNLELVGTTTNGIELYAVKDPQVDLYEVKDPQEGVWKNTNSDEQRKLDQIYQAYAAYGGASKDLTFDEYLALNPLLYWKDSFDRWSSLTRIEVKPPAECAKPVIYLYPEKTEDVNVKVIVDEFTKTVPEYGSDGWNVRAYPNGEIYNYEDGATYPYLFWEGKDKDVVSVTKGFVVERDDVENFLEKSLDKMGLTENESGDFVEFWLPKMLDNSEPYFFVSFLGTNDFNKVAPLEITPNPDTLIRVFMYYEPMDEMKEVAEQQLKSVERNGFTVVEWGGTSNTPWKD